MPRSDFRGEYPAEWPEVSLRVKVEARFRCVRCRHPGARWVHESKNPEHYMWELARRFGRSPNLRIDRVEGGAYVRAGWLPCDRRCVGHPRHDNRLRTLTVHHLDNNKSNLRWWNLAALCQVCHLQIQAKVTMPAGYLHPHSEWFLPYVAGYYASTLGEDLTRKEVEARFPELLSAGQPHLAEHYGRLFLAGRQCVSFPGTPGAEAIHVRLVAHKRWTGQKEAEDVRSN